MQKYKIKHQLRKNLPDGMLYNSQVASIVFMLGIAFKLSEVPGIISSQFESSTLWVYMVFTACEIVCALMIFAVSRMGGDALLRAVDSKPYKCTCLVASIYLSAKCTFYFCYCASYLTHELFTGAQPYLIYLLLVVPIAYLGIKGTRAIGRTCELFALLFFAVIILNLAFLDTDMDIGRNLPIFSVEPIKFFTQLPHFGLWLGDLLPLAFIRIKDKRLPYISVGFVATWSLSNLIVALGVAIYGNSLKMVSDLLIHIASFNQLSLEIGRMEWTNLLVILFMSVFSIAFLYDGAMKACDRAIGTPKPIKILCPTAILCTSVFASSTEAVTDFAIGKIGYVFFALAIILPTAILLCCLYCKHRYKAVARCMNDEYKPFEKRCKQPPDSKHSGTLAPLCPQGDCL